MRLYIFWQAEETSTEVKNEAVDGLSQKIAVLQTWVHVHIFNYWRQEAEGFDLATFPWETGA